MGLCHMSDPEGNSIEILQDTFEGTKQFPKRKEDLALGCNTKIGQITIRSSDIGATTKFYVEKLGMTLLCREKTPSFHLYFYGFTDDTPPFKNLDAVKNRTWTYKRPYTTLEVQCAPTTDRHASYSCPEDGEQGWQGTEIIIPDSEKDEFKKQTGIKDNKLTDPDGYKIDVKYR